MSLSRVASKGYTWVDQDAVGWFYLAAFLFVILPYLIMKAKAWAKGVVYDRIRENLGKYRTMPLRQLIDFSINQTLGRTVVTSLTVVLSILPLALIGGEVMRGFGLAIIFSIVIGTSSSIFIASPILLFLGEKRLRPSQTRAPQPTAGAAAR